MFFVSEILSCEDLFGSQWLTNSPKIFHITNRDILPLN